MKAALSQISSEETSSCPEGIRQMRVAMIDAGAVKDGVLVKNIKFSSTSRAAGCVMGAAAAGPKAWKNEQGVMFKDLKI